MEKDRDQRYGSMAELAADLQRHLANEPILARPPTALQRAAKWVKRNPTKSAVAGVAAGALVVISMLFAQNLRMSRDLEGSNAALQEEKDRAVAGEETATEERDRAVTAEASTQQALDDLQVKTEEVNRQAYSASIHAAGAAVGSGNTTEARRRLNDCPEELRDWEWGHLDLARDQSLKTLEGHERWVWSVAWNPAGTRIVSGSEDKTLRIWESRLEDALPMWRAVEQRRLVDSLNRLGPLLQAQGKYDEAEVLFHEALEGSRRQLGDDHPDTLKIKRSLDALLKEKQESESPAPDPPSDGKDGDNP